MIGVIIIVGILICGFVILTAFIVRNSRYDFDTGVMMGGSIIILMAIEVCLLSNIIEKPKPSALDVYQGKTTLEYTIKDGVKVDSVVVFKKKNYNEK